MQPPIPPHGTHPHFLERLAVYYQSLSDYYRDAATKEAKRLSQKEHYRQRRQDAEKRLDKLRDVFEGYQAAGLPYQAAIEATCQASGDSAERIRMAIAYPAKQKKARLAVLAEAGLEGKALAELTGYHPKAVKRALERVNHRQATEPRPRQPAEANREAPPASN